MVSRPPTPGPWCLAAAVVLLGPLAPVRAQETSERRDRIEALQAHRMLFDRRGEPMVTVGLAEHLTRLELAAEAPLTLLPEGEDAFRLVTPAAVRLVVTLEDAHQARTHHWLVAGRFPPRALEAAAAARKRFTDRGHATALFETGALTGVGGRVFDARTLTLAVGPGASPAASRAQLDALRQVGPVSGEPFVEVRERPGGTLVARDLTRGLEVRGRDLLWLRPTEGALTEVHLGGEVRRYGGELYVTVGTDGRLVLGNLSSAEALLESVVPSETFPTAPAEALKAQAVVARGQFLAKIGLKHRADPYMLCNRWHCQAHGGQGKATPQTTAAVAATRGEILTTPAGGLVDTVYHSACGGHTEAWDRAWGGSGRAGLGGVDDRPGAAAAGRPTGGHTPTAEQRLADGAPEAYCAPSGRRNGVYRWTATLTGAALTRETRKLGKLGPVVALNVLSRGRSGRVLRMEVVGRDGRAVVEGDSAIRRLLGGVKSTLVVVTREGGVPGEEPARWLIRGGGYGHGVGLCQHGAIGMANAGKSYEDILGHYYPGTKIEKGW